MNPMISSRNCTFQQSSVNCRDQCVDKEYHCKLFQQVCTARSPTGDFMLSNNYLHAYASSVFASATCLSEKVYTIHVCNSDTIDVLISNHPVYTQYTERSTHGLAHRGDCCEQYAPRILGAILISVISILLCCLCYSYTSLGLVCQPPGSQNMSMYWGREKTSS